MEKETDIFEIIEFRGKLNIRFSSFMEYVDEVCLAVTKFLELRQESMTSHMFAINLVLREGLTNAVRHGNKNDPGKIVDFQFEIVGEKSIHLRIADQGEGFDWKKYQSIKLPETEDHGRGLPIMESYFTRYSYNRKGNVLYLEKIISPKN